MTPHPLRQIIESCDRAITAKNYDALMKYYADDAALVVKPGMTVKAKRISAARLLPSLIISRAS
jgi:Ketosteroid isomerase homolog